MPVSSLDRLHAIHEVAFKGLALSFDDALWLTSDACPLENLIKSADGIRDRFHRNTVQACAISNARSGACREDCRFCAQSAHHNTSVDVYPLKETDTLLQEASRMSNNGISTFGIVTSGPTVTDNELKIICEVVGLMTKKTGLRPCASLGALSCDQLVRLREAGLKRYHHNLETSREFFSRICSTHDWDERVSTVRAAKQAGLEVCCGGLFGLGESWKDRIRLAMTLRELDIISVPVNFLNPVPGTPLESLSPLSAIEGLRILAVFRHVLPHATIRVCGGRPSTLGERQKDMFRAGANAIMTGDYLTTTGISPESDSQLIERLGFILTNEVDPQER